MRLAAEPLWLEHSVSGAATDKPRMPENILGSVKNRDIFAAASRDGFPAIPKIFSGIRG
jgi:hypothetical protein